MTCMRVSLVRHPATPCDAVDGIVVAVAQPDAATLTLRYVIGGRIDRLAVPARGVPARTDDLWKHTCCEAFLRPMPGEAYFEFNLSPSTKWATYHFDGYRRGMRNAGEIGEPEVRVTVGETELVVDAVLAVPPKDGPWHLGLTTVIEEANGRLSYWALAHPQEKPEFHNLDGFTLEL